MLVDDAIIAVEMMVLRWSRGIAELNRRICMENNSISDVDRDINYRRRLLPIATAQSSTGEYTRSIFQVVTIALLVSWVAAVLFVPYLGEKLLPDFTKTGHQAPWYVRLWARITKNRNHKL